MSSDPTFAPTVDEDARRRFEASWRAGRPEAIERFLPPADHSHFLGTLEELVAIEMEFAWKAAGPSGSDTLPAGDPPPRVEAYLARFPRLDQPEVVRRLVRHEARLRRRRGERPAVEEYRARFPAAAIEELGNDDTLSPEAAGPVPPPSLPGYEIVEELGRGGMGVVYKARQAGLNRDVAVKIILAGARASPGEVARFRAEAEAAARLRHPNIVQIYEIGERDGVPFFSLEFVEGGNLARKIGHAPQSARPTAELVETLARAVHHAHTQGVVHRDLKPANVLLTADGAPKIADFGLARRLEGGAGQTKTGEVLGTPSYMAPEQAEARPGTVGPPADVYALGAILYECLTGRPPFQGQTSWDVLTQVVSVDPVPPRRLQPKAPADLETICLKCLQKDPKRRYASAAALADDLGRFLADKTILARPAGPAERLGRWARRNRGVALAGGLAATGLVAATVVSVVLAASQYAAAEKLRQEQGRTTEALEKVRQEQGQTAEALKESRRLSASFALYEGVTLCNQDDVRPGLLWLARGLELAPPDDKALQWTLRTALAGWRPHLNAARPALQHDGPIRAAAFSPDGRLVLTVGPDRTQLWDTATGKAVGRAMPGAPGFGYAAFGPDGATFLTTIENGVALWEMAAGEPASVKRRWAWQPALNGRLSRDGKVVLTLTQQRGRLWDAVTGDPVGPFFEYSDLLFDAAISPDDRTVLTATGDLGGGVGPGVVAPRGEGRLWDAVSGQAVGEPLRHKQIVNSVAFSPDGKTVLTGSSDGTAQLWNARDGKPIGGPMGHPGIVKKVAFSPDEKLLLTGTSGTGPGTRVWGVDGHAGWFISQGGALTGVSVLAFNADGTMFASGDADGTVRLTLTASGEPWGAPLRHLKAVTAVAFSPDGKTVLTASEDGAARLWDVAPAKSIGPHLWSNIEPTCLAASPDGRTLLAGTWKGAQLWDAATGGTIGPTLLPGQWITAAAFRPDGKVATAAAKDAAYLWDAATGDPIGDALPCGGTVNAVAFRPDGLVLLTAGLCGARQQPIRFWDGASGKPLQEPPFPIPPGGWLPQAATFSRDGRTVLAGGYDRTALRFDAVTGAAAGSPVRQSAPVSAVAFSPDGTYILTAQDNKARLWESATGAPVGRISFAHQQPVTGVAFSSDGRVVLTSSQDGTAALWDASTGMLLGPPLRHYASVVGAVFARDGEIVWTASNDHTIRCWKVPTPLEGDPKRIALWVQVLTCMEMDAVGNTHELDADAWNDRLRQLDEAGGAPAP